MPLPITGLPGPLNFVGPFSTGASLIYLQFGITAPVFFGTAEGYPRHERRAQYMPVKNDLSGRMLPLDMSYQGQDATLSLDMTVWDEGLAMRLHRLPDFVGVTGSPAVPGVWSFGDMGALMALEGMTCGIYIVYPFATFRAAYSSRLVAGYHYFQAIPFGPMSQEEGAQPMIRNFQFYMWPRCDFTTQTFSLFDNNILPTSGVVINGPQAA